ncbi:ATP-binding protein [Metabacillus fastidiosus]|uniref:ATP-binding protein n=1 Tax=Metabacillus fastidiosus TaxID=1458 RepID=UPI003D2D28FB
MVHIKERSSLKYLFIFILIISILISLRFAWSKLFYTSTPPQINNGVMDLRGINLENYPPIYLDGEWEFYPGKFISGKDIESTNYNFRKIHVPGDWAGTLNKHSKSSYGYGTYRLRILIDPVQEPLGLWFQRFETSSRVELNGHAEKGIGKPAKEASEYTPRNVSYTATYTKTGMEEIELIIHVSNFDNPFKGGILKSIRFGSQASIDYVRWYSIGFQLATFLILMLHGLYAFILYSFNRKERALFMVFLLMLITGISIMINHENILLLWLSLNYSWALKIKLLSLLWGNLLILLIFRKFALASQQNRWMRLYISGLVGLTGFLLAAPAPWVNGVIHYHIFNVFYGIGLAWFIYTIGIMIFKHQAYKDIIFLLLSTAGILSNLTWIILESYFNITTVYYPIDIIVAITGFSSYWFKQYFRKANENAELTEQLQKSNKLKDQFLANTSHELRTPLHGIINIAQTVVTKEKSRMDANSVKDMELLVSVSRRMSYMLGDLLDAARLREHRIVLQQAPLQIQSIVPGVIAMLKYIAKNKPVQLNINISDSIPMVIADEKRLVQILYNLLHNALKYTETGIISISSKVRNGHAIIQISDTGVGMDEETLKKLFVPYEQGPYGINDGRGIGLGLSISKQLVELHGGTLTVTSTPGKGSVFSFDLPLAGVSNPASSKQSNQSHSIEDWSDNESPELLFSDTSISEIAVTEVMPPLLTNNKANLLAVDDDPINLKVLVSILSTEPYNITTVNSSQEVLELLNTKQWDIVIADVMMPHMSGYELTKRIREQYSLSDLPILLLTARSQATDIYTGFFSGANDYITKPVDALELKYRIRSLIMLKQSINERLRMEAAYLQAQIHPHFLFNTLNSLMALSDIDPERMRQLGDAFADFLRISFNFLNTGELVKLSHELKLSEAYLYIEKERFGDRLSVIWEVDPDINLLLPPLSIQPLVENAVKHGLLSRNKGGTLHIRIVRRQDNFTLIEVKDNGKGIEREKISQLLNPSIKGTSGIGLSNTNRRLTQLYGHGLSIVSKPNEGTTVSFVIPDTCS